MPLTKKGVSIMRKMMETYKNKGGKKKAEAVFYASAKSGKIKGVHR